MPLTPRAWAALCLYAACGAAQPADYACAADPHVVAPCFQVRGRLSYWNGTPSARIWRAGTTRMLGIHNDVLPPGLASQLRGFDADAWGLFEVCPFTRDVPGHMQFVCIESWRDLAVRPRAAPARDHAGAPPATGAAASPPANATVAFVHSSASGAFNASRDHPHE